ncbi:MAG: hypothetical protein JWN46_818 [Acidimicrobiales bacterium]|nr:hypothetical protein [Acidimicrobiales bacterium]
MEGIGAVLRKPLAWSAVVLCGLLGMVMTLSYLGGFLDPVGHLKGVRIGVIDEDHPVDVAGQHIDAGRQITRQLLGSVHREVTWVVYQSRAAALRDLRDDHLIGAIAVPAGMSRAIGRLGTTGGTAPPAALDLLANDGAGLFQTQLFATVTEQVVREVATTVNRELVGVLESFHLKISPPGAAAIGNPVVAHRVAVVAITGKTGRGLAPFYTAVMATLTGFLSASLASIAVDLLRGTEHLELLGQDIHLESGIERPLVTWAAKAVIAVSGASLGGVAIAITAVGILGMRSSGGWKVGLLAALGASTIALVTLVFLTLFGIGGELLGVMFTTIFGVPSSLGVYPVEALPGFFRFVSSWHPMHYLTDGMRAIAFYDGRSAAGLGRAVAVLVAWFVGALVVGAASAWAIGRRPSLRAGATTRARAPRPSGIT